MILMVSCLFTKHILPHSFITIDDTEKLCYPNRRASIAGHSIGLSFFCTSTVRLLIGQNLDENYKTKVSVSGIKFFSVKLFVNYLSITKKINQNVK